MTTYLRTYAKVLQPVANMDMWPVSTNSKVKPPERRNTLGRPSEIRRKEAAESKKFENLNRTGLVMTCSNCNVRGHNKRGCPQSVESSPNKEPSNSDNGKKKVSGSGKGREGEPSAKRPRGRQRRTPCAPTTPNASTSAAPSGSTSVTPSTSTSAVIVDYHISSSTPSDYHILLIPTSSKSGRGRG